MTLPGVNWYDALQSRQTGVTGADGTMLGSAMGGGSALDSIFGKLAERSAMPKSGNRNMRKRRDPFVA